jgi:hypothetical protein
MQQESGIMGDVLNVPADCPQPSPFHCAEERSRQMQPEEFLFLQVNEVFEGCHVNRSDVAFQFLEAAGDNLLPARGAQHSPRQQQS